MSEPWLWVARDVVLAIHARQIAEHGGFDGLRDPDGLDAALVRPMHEATYADPDISDLAAAYAWGVARNHPFVDGNKRTAWVVAMVFLRDNGATARYDPADAIRTFERLAGGHVNESSLAQWLRERID